MDDKLKEFEEMRKGTARTKAELVYAETLSNYKSPEDRHENKCLYFIRCEDVVKVGVAKHPQDRMKRLQTGAPAPLVLIASIPKAGHREAECHKRLAHLRVHGEWFRYTGEVNDLIGELS